MPSRSSTIRPHPSRLGTETVSALGLAAFVAALHVAVLAGRMSGRPSQHGALSQIHWQMPAEKSPDAPNHRDRIGSNPHRAYSVGRLALTRGMAVVALAAYLNVIRTNGALGR
jgi:hypothetical protein